MTMGMGGWRRGWWWGAGCGGRGTSPSEDAALRAQRRRVGALHSPIHSSTYPPGTAGEYIIKRVPLVKHIYSAAKQVGWSAEHVENERQQPGARWACACVAAPAAARLLLWPAPSPPVPPSVAPRTPAQYALRCQVSAAVSPDNEAANSFRECVLIRHPRRDGELAFAFITGQTVLQVG